jgi:hypothetical protein
MMRDDKLVRVAIRSKQTIERVVWVYGAILESAAELDDEGRYDLAADEAAYFLRADEADVGAIISALEAANRLDGDRVVNWGVRQFASDKSKDRQAAYRQRQKEAKEETGRNHSGSPEGHSDAVTTASSRHDDAPETETETETEEKQLTVVSCKKADARGTRLPDDWEPKPLTGKTAEMVAPWPAGMIERELSKFRDHFLKTPGVRGRSLDWDASYRNWLRNADERKPRLVHERSDNPLGDAVSRILRTG